MAEEFNADWNPELSDNAQLYADEPSVDNTSDTSWDTGTDPFMWAADVSGIYYATDTTGNTNLLDNTSAKLSGGMTNYASGLTDAMLGKDSVKSGDFTKIAKDIPPFDLGAQTKANNTDSKSDQEEYYRKMTDRIDNPDLTKTLLPAALTVGGAMLAGSAKNATDQSVMNKKIQADKDAAAQLVANKKTTVTPISAGTGMISKANAPQAGATAPKANAPLANAPPPSMAPTAAAPQTGALPGGIAPTGAASNYDMSYYRPNVGGVNA